jgi:signal transduction histidine kinase
MATPLRLILVEDSEDDALLLLHELRRGGYDPLCQRVETTEEMKLALGDRAWDLVIADYSLPRFSAPEALKLFQESGLDIPFIVVSGTIGEDVAVEAMRAGARDYIMKNNLARLVPAIQRELHEAEMRRQRVQLERQLHRSQKMEAIGQLAGGLAHDFNNLLTVVTGRVEVLLDRLPPEDASRREATAILEAADKGATLTRQLLAFSRRQLLQPRVLSLNTVATGMEPILRRLIGEHIILEIALAPDLGAVKADPVQLEQVILNLTVNARDAMPDGGRLTIRTANVELDEAECQAYDGPRPGPHVMLKVDDNGIGMDAEVQSHLFEPFFSTKGPTRGTGLGLATVYGVVKQSGGAIGVSSAPGRGSSFVIYLPRVDEPVEPVEPPKAFVGPLQGSETILLVEDDDEVRAVTGEILKLHRYTVLEARQGREAIALSERYEGPIHLLVTDVVMPELGGLALAKRLTQARPDLRVLYISGYSDETPVGGLSNAAFLEKPFPAGSLARKVREVLDTRR